MKQQMLHTPEGVRDIYGMEYKKKLILEERGYATEEMRACIASTYTMVAVGINLHVKIFSSLHQCFCIFCRILVVNIVISSSMAEKQMTL